MSDHSTTRSGAPKLPDSGGVIMESGNLDESDHTSSNMSGNITSGAKAKVKYSRIKRRVLAHITTVRFFLVVAILLFVVGLGFFSVVTARKLNIPFYVSILNNFLTAPTDKLASSDGRTNILIMGKAGGTHDGPDLTDTMMLASVSLTGNNVKIISIPRDTWIPDIRAKINSAYYWGNQKGVGGINFAKAETYQIVGVPIHYGVVIDFSGFKDIIDELGGIQVNVENSFTDYYYPIAGREDDNCGGHDSQFLCRYETLTFTAGPQIMDGNTALKFVRSRHALGIEGTDIAREARQGKVVEAIKNKLSNKNTFKDPRRDIALLNVVLKSIQMDFDYPTGAIMARKVYDSKDSIKSFLIPSELLFNPPISRTYDMQSVFIPKSGSGKWDDINAWVKSVLQ